MFLIPTFFRQILTRTSKDQGRDVNEKRPNVKNATSKKLQLVDFFGVIQASHSICPDVLPKLRRMNLEGQLNES